MLSQMLGKYNIDMITSNIVNMGNHTDDKGPTEYARYELPGLLMQSNKQSTRS
jgi:hypothetical protein